MLLISPILNAHHLWAVEILMFGGSSPNFLEGGHNISSVILVGFPLFATSLPNLDNVFSNCFYCVYLKSDSNEKQFFLPSVWYI